MKISQINIIQRFILVTVALLIPYSFCHAQKVTEVQKRIKTLLNDTALKTGIVSFEAKDVTTDSILFRYNENVSLMPASIQKVITTGTALETLDSTFTFDTRIGYKGTIDSNGVLHGNLYVIGSGDPTMGSSYFVSKRQRQHFLLQWATMVRLAGIKSIDGKVIIDVSHFEDWAVVGTWTYEDLGNYYGAGVYGVTLFDNICEMHFSSPAAIGAKTTYKYCVPKIPDLIIENQVVSGKGGDNAFVFQTPTSSKMIVRGDIPAGKSDFVERASIPDPPRVFAGLFSYILDSMGIKQSQSPQIVSQLTLAADANEPFNEILCYSSPTLPHIIEQTNQNSVNLFAEHILKEVGLHTKGVGSTQNGLVALFEFCKSKHIKYNGVDFVDGCGLSRFNLMSTSFMVNFLTYYYTKSPYFKLFYKSLSVAGKEGTLATFGKNTSIEGKVHAKTGSMTRVKNIAGYIETRSGRKLAFAFMANNYNCGGAKVKVIQEEVLMALYEL